MLEVKELQYFVVCADLSSFSRAAEVLYTTQPNVSKVIRSLEEKLGFEVFERDNRGIKLTRRGRQAYEYAGKILEQERQLAQIYKIDDREEFSISSNPSSWVARCFTDYYIKYSDENVRYNIMEGRAKFKNQITDKNGNTRYLNNKEFLSKLTAETHIDELAEISTKLISNQSQIIKITILQKMVLIIEVHILKILMDNIIKLQCQLEKVETLILYTILEKWTKK